MRAVYKITDTPRLGSITLLTDPELVFDLDANSTYLVRGQLRFKGSTSGDVKHGFTAGGATLLRGCILAWKWITYQADSVINANEQGGIWTASAIAADTSKPMAMVLGAYSMPVKFAGLLDIGIVGGQFGIRFAQNVADAVNPAILMAGSVVTYEKLP